MDNNIFFKQISANEDVINFKLTRVIGETGPRVFVRVLDDQKREVFLMDSKKGKWKIKLHDRIPLWLLDFEYALSEAINERDFS